MLGGVLLGGLAGEAIGIERRVEALGDRVQARMAGSSPQSTVSEGFVTASLLFCVGSLTVVGAIQDGLTGEALAVLTSAGGVTIIGIALKLLDLKDVKVGNFLPALVIAPALVGLVSLV